MLTVSGIRHSFFDNNVLADVGFSLVESQIVGLIGPSGGGKSVLLKIIAGVLEADAGELVLDNVSMDDTSLMFQEGALFDSISVFDNVAFPLVNGRVPTSLLDRHTLKEVAEKVIGILDKVGLAHAINKFPAQLSGGMRRRVSLARALVSRPKFLLLDDPTCGLDPVASSVIMELITELHQEYKPTTVIVSHDLRRLIPRVERVLALFDGRIVFDGTSEELKAAQEEVYHFVDCRYDLD